MRELCSVLCALARLAAVVAAGSALLSAPRAVAARPQAATGRLLEPAPNPASAPSPTAGVATGDHRLAIGIEPAALREVWERLTATLDDGDPRTATPADRSSLLLGWLRAGRPDRARLVVEAALADVGSRSLAPRTDADVERAAWLWVQTYWLWRAGRDPLDLSVVRAALAAGGDSLLLATLPTSADAAVLVVHALACGEGLARALGDERTAAICSRRARSDLDQLETRHWREDQASFGDGSDPASPFGCAIGMLAATGDRMPRHLESALTTCAPDTDRDLVLRTQLDRERQFALARLCGQPVAGAAAAGARLDAIGFAVSGLRYAAGPGVDERWTRVRPCLLPGATSLHLDGAVVDGIRLDLEVRREVGASVLRATVQPRDAGTSWRQIVAHLDGRVFVAAARAGEPLVLRSRDGTGPPVTSSAR